MTSHFIIKIIAGIILIFLVIAFASTIFNSNNSSFTQGNVTLFGDFFIIFLF